MEGYVNEIFQASGLKFISGYWLCQDIAIAPPEPTLPINNNVILKSQLAKPTDEDYLNMNGMESANNSITNLTSPQHIYVAQLALRNKEQHGHEVIRHANLPAWVSRTDLGQQVNLLALKHRFRLGFQNVPHQPGHCYLNVFIYHMYGP